MKREIWSDTIRIDTKSKQTIWVVARIPAVFMLTQVVLFSRKAMA
jgi:hypothetical protein